MPLFSFGHCNPIAPIMTFKVVSRAVLIFAALLLVLTALFPSPAMIALTAGATSLLVLWQAYTILREEPEQTPLKAQSPYEGYLRK